MADFERAKAYALKHLSEELDPRLTYHSLWHTQHDVVPAAARLATAETLDDETRYLLLTAAWYHDIGFLVQRDDHEDAGAAIALDVLPRFGYTAAQIDQVAGMIMATKLPQSPHTPLEEMMADADLDSIGRPQDFLLTSGALRNELAAFGTEIPIIEWYRRQQNFLQVHSYWRASAHALRDDGKQQIITMLGRLIAELEAAG
ncbi:MAG: phosphohydrolase [Anaerolineales bacterium]